MKKTVIDNFLEEKDFVALRNFIFDNHFEWFYHAHIAYVKEDSHSSFFFTHLLYDHHVPTSPHYERIIPFCKKIESTNSTTGEERKGETVHSLYSFDKQGQQIEQKSGGRGIKSLLRVRANFYPNTSTIFEHPMHKDRDFSHTAAILSLNTCDGYTKLSDGTELDSVANRVIFFDAGEDHCSTTTTNAKARFNIIVNYLE